MLQPLVLSSTPMRSFLRLLHSYRKLLRRSHSSDHCADWQHRPLSTRDDEQHLFGSARPDPGRSQSVQDAGYPGCGARAVDRPISAGDPHAEPRGLLPACFRMVEPSASHRPKFAMTITFMLYHNTSGFQHTECTIPKAVRLTTRLKPDSHSSTDVLPSGMRHWTQTSQPSASHEKADLPMVQLACNGWFETAERSNVEISVCVSMAHGGNPLAA